MPQLIPPSPHLQAAWLEAHDEWGPGLHEDGFGVTASDDVRSRNGFGRWLERLAAQSDPAQTTDVGRHGCRYWWIVEDHHVLGGIALRDGDDDYTRWAGHLGYGVRPSERGRGVATWAVGQVLTQARQRGLRRVLAVCAPDNDASVAALARNGAVFDAVLETRLGLARRYRIDLTA